MDTRSAIRFSISAIVLAVLGLQAQAADLQNHKLASATAFDIPAQSLSAALKQFADQAGIEILFEEDVVRGINAPAIRANQSAAQALTTLLSNTGLEYVARNETVAIRRKTPIASNAVSSESDSSVLRMAAQDQAQERSGNSRTDGWTRVAQENTAAAAAQSEEKAAQNDKDKTQDSTEEVIVTGSRISRTTFEMPTPVTSVDEAAIKQTGMNNIYDVLKRVPSMGIGQGTQNAQETADAGSVFIDLRGMGIQRTLTLVNGRRRVSGSNLSSAVDLSTIPTAMIEKIEIITGGASAVYGADAVTGVVTVKLREDFNGLELTGRTGMSGHGDAKSYTLSMAGGTSFSDDRGHISFGVTRTKDDPLMWRDRAFSRVNQILWANPANTGPNDGIPDNIALYNWRITPTHPAGTFVVGGTRYTIDPTLRPTQNDVFVDGFLAEGGDGFDGGIWNQLRVGNDTLSGLLNMKYDLGKGVNFFTDVHFASTKTQSPGQPTFDYGLPIFRDNPYIPAALGTLMDANGLTQLSVDRTHYDHQAVAALNNRNTYTVVTGLNGEFGNGFKWEGFYQYGEFRTEKRQVNTRITSRFYEAIDVITDPTTGQPVCRSATARAAGCLPVNILGRNGASDEALKYLHHTRLGDVRNTQQIAGLSLTGKLFDMPAGPFEFALGGEYREEGLSARDDGLAATGLLDPIFSSGFQPVDADFNVKEAYAEVLVPILKNKPAFEALNVEAALRFSDYNTIGRTTAWKYGADWAPIPDVRFRATRSRSVRAPNLNELFNPGSFSLLTVIDPCDFVFINNNPNRAANCAALGIPSGWVDPDRAFSRRGRTGGNPNLNEETSDSTTIGVVLTPRFAPSMSLSVDYWQIDIEGAVNALPGQQTVEKCVDSATINNVFCPLITRGADFAVDVVNISAVNIGKLSAEGVDFQWAYDLGRDRFGWLRGGDLLFSLGGTYLMKNEQLVDASDPLSLLVTDGEFTQPHWRANAMIGYALNAFSASWNMRYIGPSKIDVQLPREFYEIPDVDSRLYHDLFFNYDFTKQLSANLGINNVLDEDPPNNPNTYHGSFEASLFDNVGRYFFAGLQMKF